MGKNIAENILELWSNICIGWYDIHDNGSVTLHTLEDDYEHDNTEDAAEACLPTIEEWIANRA